MDEIWESGGRRERNHGGRRQGYAEDKVSETTADSKNKINQDLATKAIEQRLRQEIDSEKMRRFQQQEPSQR